MGEEEEEEEEEDRQDRWRRWQSVGAGALTPPTPPVGTRGNLVGFFRRFLTDGMDSGMEMGSEVATVAPDWTLRLICIFPQLICIGLAAVFARSVPLFRAMNFPCDDNRFREGRHLICIKEPN